ncbi:MAG: hypothetical protein AB7I27_12770 [Bacteriovoracaceae bacterium]
MFKFILVTFILSNFISISSFAGGETSGGGDASEARINEIRSDILKWITNGGAKELKLPSTLSYNQYVNLMSDILQPQKVVIGLTEEKVLVNDVEKTCKGFFQSSSSAPRILCNISRFKNTSDSDQYILIHHEYAGLVQIENNEEAASDYSISSQISEFLEVQMVLKLAVKPKSFSDKLTIICEYFPGGYDYERMTFSLDGKEIKSVEYDSSMGAIGQFEKVGDFDFQHTTQDLGINHIISIASDLKSANLTVVYKETGSLLSSGHFSCH